MKLKTQNAEVKRHSSKLKSVFRCAHGVLSLSLWLCALSFAICVSGESAPGGKTNAPGTGIATNAPAEQPIPQSVFVVPSSPQDGKDPFFPNSKRMIVVNPGKTKPAPVAADLAVKGFSGTKARPLVVINNHTFEIGGEGEVMTGSGARVHVRCLEIRPDDLTAVVEVAGQQQTLRMGRR